MFQYTNFSHREIPLADGTTLSARSSVTKPEIKRNKRVDQMLSMGILEIKEISNNTFIPKNKTVMRTSAQESQRSLILEERAKLKRAQELASGEIKISKPGRKPRDK